MNMEHTATHGNDVLIQLVASNLKRLTNQDLSSGNHRYFCRSCSHIHQHTGSLRIHRDSYTQIIRNALVYQIDLILRNNIDQYGVISPFLYSRNIPRYRYKYGRTAGQNRLVFF